MSISVESMAIELMQLGTCYSFQFRPKTRQTMPLYDYLTPKLDFKRKFNHRQSFLYKGRLTMRTIRKFRTGSSVRIKSRIGSSIRTRIQLRLIGQPIVDFLLIELFSLGVTAEALRAKIDRMLAITLQCCQFDPKFQIESVAPTNHFCTHI